MILVWLGIWSSTFAKWVRYYGKAFEHNGWIPRDHWLEDWEKQAIIKFHFDNPLNGYRRLTYMMLDANIVAVSAASVYRVLSDAGLLGRSPKATKKRMRRRNQRRRREQTAMAKRPMAVAKMGNHPL